MFGRELNNLGVAVYLLILALIATFALVAADALAEDSAPQGESGRIDGSDYDAIENAISWLLRDVPRRDERHALAPEISQLVVDEADTYGQDPWLLLAYLYKESSLKPGSVGDIGEWGLQQSHGKAAKACRVELEGRGVDPRSLRGQVACGAFLMRRGEDTCGHVVKDRERCLRTHTACSGATSWYISGSCTRTRVSEKVRSGVIRRHKLRDRLTRAGIEYRTSP